MTTELEIKARAFDRLMAFMAGQHRHKSTHYVRQPSAPIDFNASEQTMAIATVADHRVDTYEWSVCIRNSTDIERVLLDEAAAELKKEQG